MAEGGVGRGLGGDRKGIEDVRTSWRRIHRIGHIVAQSPWVWEDPGVCTLILTRKPSVQVKSPTETRYLTGSRGWIYRHFAEHKQQSADSGI